MTLPKNVWAIILLALLLTPSAVQCRPSAPASVGTLTQAQAIQRAADFCKAIGRPATMPVTAAPASASQSPILTPEYCQAGWLVHFGPNTEVGVADSGVIYRYFDTTSPGSGAQVAGRAISRKAALAISDAVLTAAHVTEPLAPPTAFDENWASTPDRETHHWTVFQKRQVQRIAFGDQHTAVMLQAESGEVQALAVCFTTPLPAPINPVVTQAQAVTAGRAFLLRQPRPSMGLRSSGRPYLVWITPETSSIAPIVNGVLAREPARTYAAALPPRLTWTCSYRDADGTTISVPVDVVTGEALSDDLGFSYPSIRPSSRPGDHKPAPDPPFPPEPAADRDVVTMTVPGEAAPAALPVGVPQYRLTLTDAYVPLSVMAALGYENLDTGLGGNATTDQAIADRLQQAAQDGKLRLTPGPSAIVPEGGDWGVVRTRATLCPEPLYWTSRPIPARIGMALTVIPMRQPDGQIKYRYKQGVKALTAGETWPGGDTGDTMRYGWSQGEAGVTTLLCALPEEKYTGTAKEPGHFRTVGIMHVILVKAVAL